MVVGSFVHPKPAPLNPGAFAPSIHWAEHQRISPIRGAYRRLYDGEIMYVHSGGISVDFEDLAEPLDYVAGDLLVLPPAIRHRISITAEPLTHLLGVHFDLFDELDLAVVGDMVAMESGFRPEWVCGWPFEDDAPVFDRRYRAIPQEIVGWMEEIFKEFKAQRLGFELVCRGYMQLIVAALLRLRTDRRGSVPSTYGEPLSKLAEALQDQLALPHTNAALAQRLNISEDHFIRLFGQRFGMSPQQYLQRLRHQAAKRYLRETGYKIEHIGSLVGYGDLHNFSHVFKKWQGVSPRAYRKMFSLV